MTLKRWLRQVGESEAFETLAELMPHAAVFAVDAQRNVVMWSDGAERLLGFERADVLGEHCLKSNRCHSCMTGCGIADHGAVRDMPLTLFAADGHPVPVRKTARAFIAADGTFMGGVEVLVPDVAADVREPPGADRGATTFHGMTSADPVMQRVFQTCRNVAETQASALVRGESGTGKELIARALHAESARANGPFVAVNCASLTPSLMESELFGHVAGAFTGAVANRQGIFEQAHGGTLFLDEIAELPLELQAKLLRVLEDGAVVPVGGRHTIRVDTRIVAATHRSLRSEVEAGRFRQDLMFRLRVVPIFLPPLRERRGDVEVLLWHFIRERNRRGPRAVSAVAPDAMRALLDHSWPGNVRELGNVVEYAFAVGRGPQIQADELPPELRVHAQPPRVLSSHRDERERIEAAIEASDGHLGRAAEQLGVSRATLWRKRKQYGL